MRKNATEMNSIINIVLCLVLLGGLALAYSRKGARQQKNQQADNSAEGLVRQRKASGGRPSENVDETSLLDELASSRTTPQRKEEIRDELSEMGYRLGGRGRGRERFTYDDPDEMNGSEGDAYEGTEPWIGEDDEA